MSEDTLPAGTPAETVDIDDVPDAVDEAAIRRMHAVVRLLDDGVRLPVVGVRVGIDPLLGLVPVVGDALSAAFGLYIVVESARLGVSYLTLVRMVANVAVDVAVGSVPVVGDLFDVLFRAHRRNLNLALADLDVTVGSDTEGDDAGDTDEEGDTDDDVTVIPVTEA